MATLERTTFAASRAGEYFDARQLSALTGTPQDEFASVCLKELIDNALDAAETARVAPKMVMKVDDVRGKNESEFTKITVADNGPGIPPETVRKILDYNVRVSDKAAYRSPTRGAQGNALKTIIGIPYALGARGPSVVISARGVEHTIKPWINPAGEVRIAHTVTDKAHEGTIVSLAIPKRRQNFDPVHWVRSFAAFNPHATLSYQANGADPKDAEMYKCTTEKIKKYVPSEPTSPHWHSEESLKALVFSHIAHARNGGRDLPVGEFVRQFAGLSRPAKAKAVRAELNGFTHLSDFEDDPEAVGTLLAAMRAGSKPPKPTALGWVGKDHYETFFDRVYDDVNEFQYKRATGTLPSGLPFTFEFALATLEQPGHLYCGINFSPTFGDPLEGTTLIGPQFSASGLRGFLSQGHALPEMDSSWYSSPASVAVADHILTPAPINLDRGKTRLNMEGA